MTKTWTSFWNDESPLVSDNVVSGFGAGKRENGGIACPGSVCPVNWAMSVKYSCPCRQNNDLSVSCLAKEVNRRIKVSD